MLRPARGRRHRSALGQGPTARRRCRRLRHWHELSADERAAGARPLPGAARRGARALPRLRRRVLGQIRCRRGLPRGLRRRAHPRRLALRDDPGRIRRLGPRARRSLGDHGGNQSLRRQRGIVSRADVQHGNAVAPRLGRAEEAIPPRDRERQAAPSVDGGHRAFDRHRHDPAQDDRGAPRRPLRRQRTEGVDLAAAALRPDDRARADHAAQRGPAQVGRNERVPGRRARRARRRNHDRAADRNMVNHETNGCSSTSSRYRRRA